LRRGCAALAFSIWDEERRVPIDHVVHTIAVGGAECVEVARSASGSSLLGLMSGSGRDSRLYGAMQLIELPREGRRPARTVAVYVPALPFGGCRDFAWETEATLTSYVFSAPFMAALQRAWDTEKGDPDRYPAVAKRLRRLVFPLDPEGDGKCGGKQALEAVRDLATVKGRSMHLHLVDATNTSRSVPLALLFGLQDDVGPYFASTPLLHQSLPVESLEAPIECVRHWTFLLPEYLEGHGNVDLPPDLEGSYATERSLESFRDLIMGMDSGPDGEGSPVGIVLLGHHVQGEIHTDDPDDFLAAADLKSARFPRGSVAVLAACATGDLRGTPVLVDALNRAGFDTIILSPYEVQTDFGVALAISFAEEVLRSSEATSPPRVDDLFEQALEAAITNLGDFSKYATGMARELLVAGRADTRVCVDPKAPE
jgi:hypothetical protein